MHQHWDGAPRWAHRLRDLMITSLQQGQHILEAIAAIKPSLPPDEQKKLNDAYDAAVVIKAKIDAAET